jgi:hypothetical protein
MAILRMSHEQMFALGEGPVLTSGTPDDRAPADGRDFCGGVAHLPPALRLREGALVGPGGRVAYYKGLCRLAEVRDLFTVDPYVLLGVMKLDGAILAKLLQDIV